MAQYELSSTLFKYLDRHLCFPLLEFLQDKGLYNEEDIMRAKIGLLQNTNMVDFAMDIHKELYGADVPEVMKKRREEVVSRLRTLQKAVQPIMACLSDPNVIRNFRHVSLSLQVSFRGSQQISSKVQLGHSGVACDAGRSCWPLCDEGSSARGSISCAAHTITETRGTFDKAVQFAGATVIRS
jgi:hypothetical protein